MSKVGVPYGIINFPYLAYIAHFILLMCLFSSNILLSYIHLRIFLSFLEVIVFNFLFFHFSFFDNIYIIGKRGKRRLLCYKNHPALFYKLFDYIQLKFCFQLFDTHIYHICVCRILVYVFNQLCCYIINLFLGVYVGD